MNNKMMHMISFLMVIIGGLNWGLIGLFNFDLVNAVFGFSSLLVKLVLILVGLAAVYLLATHKKDCKNCRIDGHEKHEATDAPVAPSVPETPES